MVSPEDLAKGFGGGASSGSTKDAEAKAAAKIEKKRMREERQQKERMNDLPGSAEDDKKEEAEEKKEEKKEEAEEKKEEAEEKKEEAEEKKEETEEKKKEGKTGGAGQNIRIQVGQTLANNKGNIAMVAIGVMVLVVILVIAFVVPSARAMVFQSEGSSGFGLGLLIQQIAGVGTISPLQTDKEVKTGTTLATNPFYSFKIESLTVTPMRGQMFFPGGYFYVEDFLVEKDESYAILKGSTVLLTKKVLDEAGRTASNACEVAMDDLSEEIKTANSVGSSNDLVIRFNGSYYPCEESGKISLPTEAGQTFLYTSMVKNTGDKIAQNMTVVLLPHAKDSKCRAGASVFNDKYIYDWTPLNKNDLNGCDVIFHDSGGIISTYDVCAESFDLTKSGTKTFSCRIKFGCVPTFSGCECNPSEDGCGFLSNLYAPSMYVRLVGPYVSTTRLDIQTMDGDYYGFLSTQNLFFPFTKTAINSWGAVTLFMDTATDKQPVLSFYNIRDQFTLRVKYDIQQKSSGKLIEPFTERIRGTDTLLTKLDSEKPTYGDMQAFLNSKDSAWMWDSAGPESSYSRYYKERLFLLIPSKMLYVGQQEFNSFYLFGSNFNANTHIQDNQQQVNLDSTWLNLISKSIWINGLICGDYVRKKLCDNTTNEYKKFLASNIEFTKTASSYCSVTNYSVNGDYSNGDYVACEVFQGEIGEREYTLNQGEEYQFSLLTPDIDTEAGTSRETYILRADLLYYFVVEQDQQTPVTVYSKLK